ncbi:hypothetical protein [Floridanema evergladense]
MYKQRHGLLSTTTITTLSISRYHPNGRTGGNSPKKTPQILNLAQLKIGFSGFKATKIR